MALGDFKCCLQLLFANFSLRERLRVASSISYSSLSTNAYAAHSAQAEQSTLYTSHLLPFGNRRDVRSGNWRENKEGTGRYQRAEGRNSPLKSLAAVLALQINT